MIKSYRYFFNKRISVLYKVFLLYAPLVFIAACTDQRYLPLIDINPKIIKLFQVEECRWYKSDSRNMVCTVKNNKICSSIYNKQIVVIAYDYQGWKQFRYYLEERTEKSTGEFKINVPVGVMTLRFEPDDSENICK